MNRIALLKEDAVVVKADLNLDRPRLLTEGYRLTEGEPIIYRRCFALAHYLRNCRPVIRPGELIVGYQTAAVDAREYPEFWGMWCPAPDSEDPAVAAEIAEIAAYWQAHPELRACGNLLGHCVPGFERVIERGFDALSRQAERCLNGQGRIPWPETHLPVEYTPEDFWRGAALLAEACGQFGRNYAKEARRLAKLEDDPVRKAELLEIAEVCSRVPAKGARTFHEGLQSLWFAFLFAESEDPPNAHSIGRIDQMLGPLYERDLEAGTITDRQAKDLVKAFWLKMYKGYDVQNCMLGGQTRDGEDASNAVTALILDAMDELHVMRQTSLRWHKKQPKRVLRKACKVVSHGLDQPQFFNDEAIIPALTSKGIPLEDAREFGIIGCIEIIVPGKHDPRVVAHYANLLKCLELALNNGVDMLTGEQRGPQTGDFAKMSFEELWNAYEKQVEVGLGASLTGVTGAEADQAARFPMPVLSLLTDDCVARGLDITAGGARYNSTGVCAMGIPNIADSLAAIKHFVYDSGEIKRRELLSALRKDFKGKEDLRLKLLRGAPKYGNDDPAVDEIAARVAHHFCSSLDSFSHPRGGRYFAHLFTFTVAVPAGRECAASPDGRHARQDLANSLMPGPGRGILGPSAALKSAAAIDQTEAAAGTSVITELHPNTLPKGHEPETLAALVQSYFEGGGMHLEFNIVGPETLRAAQADPEKYRSVVVRVSGYSAFFVHLDRELQNHIIERAEDG
jgi:formate C-acetyltransferase